MKDSLDTSNLSAQGSNVALQSSDHDSMHTDYHALDINANNQENHNINNSFMKHNFLPFLNHQHDHHGYTELQNLNTSNKSIDFIMPPTVSKETPSMINNTSNYYSPLPPQQPQSYAMNMVLPLDDPESLGKSNSHHHAITSSISSVSTFLSGKSKHSSTSSLASTGHLPQENLNNYTYHLSRFDINNQNNNSGFINNECEFLEFNFDNNSNTPNQQVIDLKEIERVNSVNSNKVVSNSTLEFIESRGGLSTPSPLFKLLNGRIINCANQNKEQSFLSSSQNTPSTLPSVSKLDRFIGLQLNKYDDLINDDYDVDAIEDYDLDFDSTFINSYNNHRYKNQTIPTHNDNTTVNISDSNVVSGLDLHQNKIRSKLKSISSKLNATQNSVTASSDSTSTSRISGRYSMFETKNGSFSTPKLNLPYSMGNSTDATIAVAPTPLSSTPKDLFVNNYSIDKNKEVNLKNEPEFWVTIKYKPPQSKVVKKLVGRKRKFKLINQTHESKLIKKKHATSLTVEKVNRKLNLSEDINTSNIISELTQHKFESFGKPLRLEKLNPEPVSKTAYHRRLVLKSSVKPTHVTSLVKGCQRQGDQINEIEQKYQLKKQQLLLEFKDKLDKPCASLQRLTKILDLIKTRTLLASSHEIELADNAQQNSISLNQHSLTKELFKDNVLENNRDFSLNFQKIPLDIFLGEFTKERSELFLVEAQKKKLSSEIAQSFMDLFKNRNIIIKLQILNKLIGKDSLLVDSKDFSEAAETSNFDSSFPYTEIANDEAIFVREVTQDDEAMIGPNFSGLVLRCKTYTGSESLDLLYQNSILKRFKHISQLEVYFKPTYNVGTKNDENDQKYIKRPLNSFMLYRVQIVKAFMLLLLIDSLTSYIFDKCKFSGFDVYDQDKELIALRELQNKINEYEAITSTQLSSLTNSPSLSYTKTSIPKFKKLKKELNNLQIEIEKYLVISKSQFSSHSLIQLISVMWKTESESTKEQFAELSDLDKLIHIQCFPDYKYHPFRKDNV